MKTDQDFEGLIREAQALRSQFIGGLLRRAWNAGLRSIQLLYAAMTAHNVRRSNQEIAMRKHLTDSR